jgi:hypothetical protein
MEGLLCLGGTASAMGYLHMGLLILAESSLSTMYAVRAASLRAVETDWPCPVFPTSVTLDPAVQYR